MEEGAKKVEMELNYSKLMQQAATLESSIHTLALEISKIEKRKFEIDYDVLLIMKSMVEDGSNLRTEKLDQLSFLMEEDKIENEKYLKKRREKDNLLSDLKKHYAYAIKSHFLQPDNRSKHKSAGVDLSTSQLTSGSSNKGGDDMSIFLNSSCWIPDSDISLVTSNERRHFLGAGVSTEVYRGFCRGKEVAVKLLLNKFDEKNLESFRKECQVLKGILNHPNLLLFMGACLDAGSYKIVMEWAANGSLQSLILDKKIKLSFTRKITMLKDICKGMNWLHTSKPPVLHLNLKPSNILLSSNYTIKIADYGLAQNQKSISNNAVIYVAPELLKGDTATSKADVFSYGMLSWFLLLEKEPFEQSLSSLFQDTSRYYAHLMSDGRPALPTDSSSISLTTTIKLCWHSDPSKRPSFEELNNDALWNRMVNEVHRDADAAAIWKEFGQKTVVPWKDLAALLAQYLGLPKMNEEMLQRQEWQCLKVLMEASQDDEINHTHFLRFLSYFGPVRTGDQGIVWMTEIRNLLSKKWFHGPIDSNTALNRINAQIAKSKSKISSGVILRFSNQESTFTLSFKKPKANMTNVRLERPAHYTDVTSLIAYVEKYIKKFQLDPTSYDRCYEHIFQKTIEVGCYDSQI